MFADGVYSLSVITDIRYALMIVKIYLHLFLQAQKSNLPAGGRKQENIPQPVGCMNTINKYCES